MSDLITIKISTMDGREHSFRKLPDDVTAIMRSYKSGVGTLVIRHGTFGEGKDQCLVVAVPNICTIDGVPIDIVEAVDNEVRELIAAS